MAKPISKDAPKGQSLARGKYPPVPVRIHPDNLAFIEEAAWRSKKKRSHFIEQAALKEAERILGRQTPVPVAA